MRSTATIQARGKGFAFEVFHHEELLRRAPSKHGPYESPLQVGPSKINLGPTKVGPYAIRRGGFADIV